MSTKKSMTTALEGDDGASPQPEDDAKTSRGEGEPGTRSRAEEPDEAAVVLPPQAGPGEAQESHLAAKARNVRSQELKQVVKHGTVEALTRPFVRALAKKGFLVSPYPLGYTGTKYPLSVFCNGLGSGTPPLGFVPTVREGFTTPLVVPRPTTGNTTTSSDKNGGTAAPACPSTMLGSSCFSCTPPTTNMADNILSSTRTGESRSRSSTTTVRLVFGGDLMPLTGKLTGYGVVAEPELQSVVNRADVVVVNLEGLVAGTTRRRGLNLRMGCDFIKATLQGIGCSLDEPGSPESHVASEEARVLDRLRIASGKSKAESGSCPREGAHKNSAPLDLDAVVLSDSAVGLKHPERSDAEERCRDLLTEKHENRGVSGGEAAQVAENSKSGGALKTRRLMNSFRAAVRRAGSTKFEGGDHTTTSDAGALADGGTPKSAVPKLLWKKSTANMRMRDALRGLLGESRLLRQGAGEPVAQARQVILCGVSNNHSGDGGRAGLKDTVRHVETKLGANVVEFGHFMTPGRLLTTVRVPLDRGERGHSGWAGAGVGAGTGAVAGAGADTSQEGKNTSTSTPSFLNIGFLNATSVMNWGKRNASLPVFRTEYLLEHDWNLVKRAEGVHFLVAYLHWDREQRYMPRAETVRVAERLARAGIDLIVGHGPHVCQGAQEFPSCLNPITGVASSTLCVYSLGNLCSEKGKWHTKVGGLLEVTLAVDVSGQQQDSRGGPDDSSTTHASAPTGGENNLLVSRAHKLHYFTQNLDKPNKLVRLAAVEDEEPGSTSSSERFAKKTPQKFHKRLAAIFPAELKDIRPSEDVQYNQLQLVDSVSAAQQQRHRQAGFVLSHLTEGDLLRFVRGKRNPAENYSQKDGPDGKDKDMWGVVLPSTTVSVEAVAAGAPRRLHLCVVSAVPASAICAQCGADESASNLNLDSNLDGADPTSQSQEEAVFRGRAASLQSEEDQVEIRTEPLHRFLAREAGKSARLLCYVQSTTSGRSSSSYSDALQHSDPRRALQHLLPDDEDPKFLALPRGTPVGEELLALLRAPPSGAPGVALPPAAGGSATSTAKDSSAGAFGAAQLPAVDEWLRMHYAPPIDCRLSSLLMKPTNDDGAVSSTTNSAPVEVPETTEAEERVREVVIPPVDHSAQRSALLALRPGDIVFFGTEKIKDTAGVEAGERKTKATLKLGGKVVKSTSKSSVGPGRSGSELGLDSNAAEPGAGVNSTSNPENFIPSPGSPKVLVGNRGGGAAGASSASAASVVSAGAAPAKRRTLLARAADKFHAAEHDVNEAHFGQKLRPVSHAALVISAQPPPVNAVFILEATVSAGKGVMKLGRGHESGGGVIIRDLEEKLADLWEHAVSSDDPDEHERVVFGVRRLTGLRPRDRAHLEQQMWSVFYESSALDYSLFRLNFTTLRGVRQLWNSTRANASNYAPWRVRTREEVLGKVKSSKSSKCSSPTSGKNEKGVASPATKSRGDKKEGQTANGKRQMLRQGTSRYKNKSTTLLSTHWHEQEAQGFFCSELVYFCYIRGGLLEGAKHMYKASEVAPSLLASSKDFQVSLPDRDVPGCDADAGGVGNNRSRVHLTDFEWVNTEFY